MRHGALTHPSRHNPQDAAPQHLSEELVSLSVSSSGGIARNDATLRSEQRYRPDARRRHPGGSGLVTADIHDAYEVVDTVHNNGSSYCSAYCSHNMNGELPTSWRGACCQQAFGPANESIGCHETRGHPITCRCLRALRPFVGFPVAAPPRNYTEAALDLHDPRYVCREFMDTRLHKEDIGRCTAHCAYNAKKELPKHWRGACCERSYNGTHDVSCQNLKAAGDGQVQCRCKRDDAHPFLHPSDASSLTDFRYSCRGIRRHDQNLSLTVPDRAVQWTKQNPGGVMCSAYCAYNYNQELPASWRGACCQEATDHQGKPFPCSATSPASISCKCVQAERPFLTNGVDGNANDDERYECKFREVTPVDTNQTKEWTRGRWVATAAENASGNVSWSWREGEWTRGEWRNARFHGTGPLSPVAANSSNSSAPPAVDVFNTTGNNGGVYCAAYCAYNYNRELPLHWRGACCYSAFTASGQPWSCRRHSEAGMTCECVRRDSVPFEAIQRPQSADDRHQKHVCAGAHPSAYSSGPMRFAVNHSENQSNISKLPVVRTQLNNGGVFCSAYCAYNLNGELPHHWKGACCQAALNHNGSDFSCVAHSRWNITCLCQQSDHQPFLNLSASPNPFMYRDRRHVCGVGDAAPLPPPPAVLAAASAPSKTLAQTRSHELLEQAVPAGSNVIPTAVKTLGNRGGVTCVAYCSYNWNRKLPSFWRGACCLEAWDHRGESFPCDAHDTDNITCHCAQYDEVPFKSPSVDGDSNDDVHSPCPASVRTANAANSTSAASAVEEAVFETVAPLPHS